MTPLASFELCHGHIHFPALITSSGTSLSLMISQMRFLVFVTAPTMSWLEQNSAQVQVA